MHSLQSHNVYCYIIACKYQIEDDDWQGLGTIRKLKEKTCNFDAFFVIGANHFISFHDLWEMFDGFC